MRRVLPLAVLLLLSVTACDTADPEASAGSPTLRPEVRGDADSVLVIGDSLVHGADRFGDLADGLDAAGFETVEIVAEVGRDTRWGIEQVTGRDAVPEVVVVELGTNPGANPDGFAELASELVVALRERGAERIAWVTPVHARDDRYDEKSEILSTTPGIDLVADWGSRVRDDPRRLASDGLHPTEEGYVELAGFLVDSAASVAG